MNLKRAMKKQIKPNLKKLRRHDLGTRLEHRAPDAKKK